MTFSEKVLQRY
jgi:hypothetical protein